MKVIIEAQEVEKTNIANFIPPIATCCRGSV